MAMSRDFGSLQSTGSTASYPSPSTPPVSLLQMKGIPNNLFKKKVDEQFLCGSCKMVLRWPMQTSCGCRFCFGCIYNYVGDKKGEMPCPNCEDNFDIAEINRDNYSRKNVEKMTVFCQNKPNGCADEMKLKDFDIHVESCPYQRIECVHKSQGCTAVLLRGQLAEHLQSECQFRSEKCEYCEEEFSVADLKIHQQKCIASVIECPNKCSSKGIHQDKMMKHLKTDCPLVVVDCFFKGYGCEHRYTRQDMKTHKEDSQADHLELLVKWLEETRLKMTETQHLLQEMSNNRGIMETQVQTMTTDLGNLQIVCKKNETLTRELQKLVAKHSDEMETIQSQARQAAKKEDIVELKKTFFKPLQEKQDQMDDRLKRMERGDFGVGGGTGGSGGGGGGQGTATAGGVSNARVTSVENQMGMHAVRLAEHDLRFQVLETANYEGVLLWKIKDFARRKRDADSGKTLSLYSQPFYTSRYGYKMCARIYLNGDGMGKGTHVSLFFVVMRGDYDALLPWPFRQKVTLMLLDQETGRRHLSDSFRPDPKSSSFQRPTTEMNIASGCPLFVNQSVLKDATYVKDDVIFIKVIVDTSDLYGP